MNNLVVILNSYTSFILRAHVSTYHALGKGTMLFMQALLTMESVSLIFLLFLENKLKFINANLLFSYSQLLNRMLAFISELYAFLCKKTKIYIFSTFSLIENLKQLLKVIFFLCYQCSFYFLLYK